MENTILFPKLSNSIDNFGSLYFEHKRVSKALETEKEFLKLHGSGEYEGSIFKIKITETPKSETKVVDYKELAVRFCALHGIDFQPSIELINECTTLKIKEGFNSILAPTKI